MGGKEMNNFKWILLTGGVALISVAPTNALAQESEASGRTDTDEIVVTAQKRTESLQDVPIAISVITGKQLDQSPLSGVSEALRAVPGLDTQGDQYVGGTAISLRGVSSPGFRDAGAGTVAFYIDGVSYGFIRNSFFPTDPGAYDLDRIEVLAGPQGTLYGANALNGVIRILTHNADVERFSLKTRTGLSGTEGGGTNYRADGAVNIPIIPGKVGVRFVASYQNDSGWIDSPSAKDVNDTERLDYRLKIRLQPTQTLTMDFGAWRSRADIGASSFSTDDQRISSLVPQPLHQKFEVYSANISKEFPDFSVTTTTSYFDFNASGRLDGTPCCGPIALDTVADSRVFTQEVNLVSTDKGPWRWSVGAYYRDAKDIKFQDLAFLGTGTALTLDHFEDTSKSKAVYGELGRRLLDDTIDLSLGLRYFHDSQELRTLQSYGPGLPANTSFKAKFDALTPRVVLTWKPSSDQMVYASYSAGFRSGLNQAPNVLILAPQYPPVRPDRLRNYELGTKASFLDRKVSVESAVYYIDWKDIQQNLFVIDPNGVGFPALINGVSASGLGFLLQLTARPLDGLSLNANANIVDLTYDDDVVSGGIILFKKGSRILNAPKYTFGGSADYSFALGSTGYEGQASISGAYKSEQNTADRSAVIRSKPIFIANASFALKAPEHWRASIFVNNLFDEYDSPAPSAAVPEWSARPRPRTFGLQVEYDF
jgi:outer membrane receptor protein involved in Fe transport